EGTLPEDFQAFSSSADNRRVCPADIYDGYRQAFENLNEGMPSVGADGKRRLTHAYLEISTDEGITGRNGPIKSPLIRERILRSLAPILIGLDPFNNEMIWDILYRSSTNSYAGSDLEAISACDNALWDIKAKAAGMPLNRLLGGVTQPSLPAYCNCVGYSYAPEDVIDTVAYVKSQGYKSTKWVAPAGPGEGEAGMQKVENHIRLLREAGGPDFQIMMDCSCSWDYDFTIRMAKRLEKYDLYWIEEPLMPQQIDSYVKLAKHSPIRIALGENLYTRWSFKRYLDRKAADIYQPDPNWCGGLTEALKIMALITSSDMPVALHGAMPPVCVHLASAYPKTTILTSEYLDLVTRVNQYFYQEPIKPEGGAFHLPTMPGLGIELDMEKVQRDWYQDKGSL
ncbi:MAG: mandelate racemase/muconate lactonizing enzyme family protein, partial [Peptococcaceae bacterium]|nr:mandelate racemase/muconate lactonizing enzyme family protein [Peptococcaceae bacterium]